MSCCDNATVIISNLSGQTISWSVENAAGGATPGSGTTQNGGAPSVITVASAKKTEGAASGQVVITFANSQQRINLPYQFTPKDKGGGCPCTAARYGTFNGPNFQASPTSTNGTNNKKGFVASMNWTLKPAPAPPT